MDVDGHQKAVALLTLKAPYLANQEGVLESEWAVCRVSGLYALVLKPISAQRRFTHHFHVPGGRIGSKGQIDREVHNVRSTSH